MDKNELVIKSERIIVTTIFICQIAGKTFATQCFFTDHLNYKILNKTTCNTNQQILTNYMQISLRVFEHYFLRLFRTS